MSRRSKAINLSSYSLTSVKALILFIFSLPLFAIGQSTSNVIRGNIMLMKGCRKFPLNTAVVFIQNTSETRIADNVDADVKGHYQLFLPDSLTGKEIIIVSFVGMGIIYKRKLLLDGLPKVVNIKVRRRKLQPF